MRQACPTLDSTAGAFAPEHKSTTPKPFHAHARLGKTTRHLSLQRQNPLAPSPCYTLDPAVLGEGVEHGVDHGVLVAPADDLALDSRQREVGVGGGREVSVGILRTSVDRHASACMSYCTSMGFYHGYIWAESDAQSD